MVQQEIVQKLEAFFLKEVPRFNQTFELVLIQEKIKYDLQDESKAYYHESLWACPLVFSALPLMDFLWILSAVLHEKHLVFVSNNISLLTATIITFLSVIKPLKWVQPCVCMLPKDLIDMLAAPVPVIVGLTMSKSHVDREQMQKNYENCSFIFLDDGITIQPSAEAKDSYFSEFFDRFKDDLLRHYQKLNPWPSSNSFLNGNRKSTTKDSRSLIYNPSKEESDHVLAIINYLYGIFNAMFKDSLPKQPTYKQTEDGQVSTP